MALLMLKLSAFVACGLIQTSSGANHTCGLGGCDRAVSSSRSLLQANIGADQSRRVEMGEFGDLTIDQERAWEQRSRQEAGHEALEDGDDSLAENERCKIRVCKDDHFGPNNCDGGETFSDVTSREFNLESRRRRQMEDEVSSVWVGDGCEKVILYDEDNDGDTMTLTAPGRNDLPWDFDNDVGRVMITPKAKAHYASFPDCEVKIYEDNGYDSRRRRHDYATFTVKAEGSAGIHGKTFNLQGSHRRRRSAEDEISSIKVGEGCAAVKLIDEDGDGDEIWAMRPGISNLPGDFDNDVKELVIYPRDANQHPTQGRCPAGYEPRMGVGEPLQHTFQSGLEGTFYTFDQGSTMPNAQTLKNKNPAKTKIDETINYAQSDSFESVVGRKNNFYAVWEGALKIVKPGEYTFFLKSSDGSSLKLDGTAVVSNEGKHGVSEKDNGKRPSYLSPGMHNVKLELFVSKGAEARMVLSYKGPDTDQSKTVIPKGKLFTRIMPTLKQGFPVFRQFQAFAKCQERSDCCGVAQTADGLWNSRNEGAFVLVNCQIKETGSDKTWWASCSKKDKKKEICDATAQYSDKPFAFLTNNNKLDYLVSLISSGFSSSDKAGVKEMLAAYSSMHSSATFFQDDMMMLLQQEISLLALNVAAHKFGEGKYATRWGEGIMKTFKENACRQTKVAADLPFMFLPGTCDNFNRYRAYQTWYNDLPTDIKEVLDKYAIAALSKELKIDVEGDSDTAYTPWTECWKDKKSINDAMSAMNVELMRMFTSNPQVKKHAYNEIINSKPELCQWRTFLDTYANIGYIKPLLKMLRRNQHQVVHLMKDAALKEQAVAIFTDLNLLADALVIFSHSKKFHKIDEQGEQTSVAIVSQSNKQNFGLVSMLLTNHHTSNAVTAKQACVDNAASLLEEGAEDGAEDAAEVEVGAECNKNEGRIKAALNSKGESLSGVELKRAAMLLNQIESQMACGGMDTADCDTHVQKALTQVYKDSSELQDKVAKYTAQMALLGSKLGRCLDENQCQLDFDMSVDSRAIQDEYSKLMDRHSELLWQSAQRAGAKAASTVWASTAPGGAIMKYLNWKNWRAAQVAAINVNLGTGTAFVDPPDPREAALSGKTLKASGKWARFKHSMSNAGETGRRLWQLIGGEKAWTNMKLYAGHFKDIAASYASSFVTKVTSSLKKLAQSAAKSLGMTGKMVSAGLTTMGAISSTSVLLAKGFAMKIVGILAIIGIVTDIKDLIEFFDEGGNVAAGIFSCLSIVSGVISVVTGVLGLISAGAAFIAAFKATAGLAAGIAAGAAAAVAAGAVGGAAATGAAATAGAAAASAWSVGFGFGTGAGTSVGPLAPLVGLIIGGVAALGALIVALVNKPPGSQKEGDRFCCYNFALGIDQKYLIGTDSPGFFFKGKSMSDCHDFDFSRPDDLLIQENASYRSLLSVLPHRRLNITT
eukprot:TRINITY_DN23212_c0_g2_i1.p1 TRINITY_DN23212_c0_g2~~TRINITY_DN23212_c0_g2_i1.p1  ORF type:complete len:1463 (+),score=299.80 TRINITY_DN23212_c0_g2_i1:76-4389(+)